jgi:hypothetical protein
MGLEKGFLGGFLVLAFALFIAGILTGMLSFAVLHVTPDFATVGLMIFAFGFLLGMLAVALTLVVVRLSGEQRS